MPTLRLEDVTLHYDECGDGPPLVFIPGIGAGGTLWFPVTEELSSRYRCITIDNRGAGFSEVTKGPYRIVDLARDTARLLTALNVQSSVVVGHSMGGFVALALARHHTSALSLKGLGLLSTGGSGSDLSAAWRSEEHRILATPSLTRDSAVRAIAAFGLGKIVDPGIVDQFVQLTLTRPLRGAGFLAQKAAVDAFDLSAELDRITPPCCIMHGTHDTIIPMTAATRLHRGLPRASFVSFSGVGHFPTVECPKQIVATIDDFSRTAFSA